MATVGVPDCTQLMQLTDETVVENLRVRYDKDEIHTFVGNMLLVLNPYRQLPIYESAGMEKFRDVHLTRAPPHIFAVAEEVRATRSP